jgi:uncharacterized membrane protein
MLLGGMFLFAAVEFRQKYEKGLEFYPVYVSKVLLVLLH